MSKPTHIAMPVDVAQAIADYLVTKPFNEVAKLLGSLQACKPIEPPKALRVVDKPAADTPAES